MDVYLLIGLALLAVMVASVVLVGAADRHSRSIAEADERQRRSGDELRELDAIIDGVGGLAIPDAFRDLLRKRRTQLTATIDPRFVPPVPIALDIPEPARFASSQLALTNFLGDLQAARRFLRELERQGHVSNTERLPMAQQLSALSVSLQAESFVAWSEMPGVDANGVDAYLRDAQEVLSKSLHLDRGFGARMAALKERQEALAAERVLRAREEAEVRAAQERHARNAAGTSSGLHGSINAVPMAGAATGGGHGFSAAADRA
jgi:hypothetical protein